MPECGQTKTARNQSGRKMRNNCGRSALWAGGLPVQGVLVVLQVGAVGQHDGLARFESSTQLQVDITRHGGALLQVGIAQRGIQGQAVGSRILGDELVFIVENGGLEVVGIHIDGVGAAIGDLKGERNGRTGDIRCGVALAGLHIVAHGGSDLQDRELTGRRAERVVGVAGIDFAAGEQACTGNGDSGDGSVFQERAAGKCERHDGSSFVWDHISFCQNGLAYTIGENRADVNAFHRFFEKISPEKNRGETKFRPKRSAVLQVGSAHHEGDALAGCKGGVVGHGHLLPAGGHHADQLNVAGALRGQAGHIGEALRGGVVQGDVSAGLGSLAVHGDGEVGGGSGQRMEVGGGVGGAGSLIGQGIGGVDLRDVLCADGHAVGLGAVDSRDQNGDILVASHIGCIGQREDAGQLDAQVVPVADLIADLHLDRAAGRLAAAQHGCGTQCKRRNAGDLQKSAAGNLVRHKTASLIGIVFFFYGSFITSFAGKCKPFAEKLTRVSHRGLLLRAKALDAGLAGLDQI